MVDRRAVGLQASVMLGGGITLVVLPVVIGALSGQRIHVIVAVGLARMLAAAIDKYLPSPFTMHVWGKPG